jgi:uncharacterized membrane protein
LSPTPVHSRAADRILCHIADKFRFPADPTVSGAMLLVLACVGWLIFFINHISQSISVNHIVEGGRRQWSFNPPWLENAIGRALVGV